MEVGELMLDSIKADYSAVAHIPEKELIKKNEITGFIHVNVRASRIGVMPYKDPLEGKPHFELKLPKELFSIDTMSSFNKLPVTDEHPKEMFVTPDNSKKLMVGFTDPYAWVENHYYLASRITISDSKVISRIYEKSFNGESQQVSCGYIADIEEKEGEWNGIKYHRIQRNIRFNHLALVRIGRGGKDVEVILKNEYKTEE